MQNQSQPSLESIFGGASVNPNRPSLDSILGVTAPVKKAETTPSFTERVTTDLKKRGENILENTGEMTEQSSILRSALKLPETVIRNAGQIAGGIGDVMTEAIVTAIPDEVKAKATSIFQTPEGQKALESMNNGMEAYTKWAEANPNISKDLEAVLNIASVIPAVKGGKLAVDTGVDITGDLAKAGMKKVDDATKFTRDMTVGMYDKAKDLTKGVDSTTLSDTLSSPEVLPFIQSSPANIKVVESALKQGFQPKDIKFMSTIGEADKQAIREMKDLAEKASGDLRAEVGKRPIDVVGDSGVDTLREIQKVNAKSGADVDATARALAGQEVATDNLSEQALKLLSDSGIVIRMSPNGRNTFDFSKSIFKKTPAITKTLERALSDMPNLSMDAYDLHKFKKSLDEVVSYGTQGEGLDGKAKAMLKQIRGLADETLDSKFPEYNKANTDFKVTRELLDEAQGLVGKNTDFLTKQASQDFGQTMRSLFSNNKTRGRLTTFLENLQTTAKTYGLPADKNLVDQAIFAQILESVYGTQAITGLQGEVTKAIKKGLDFVDRPVGASIDTVLEKVEKMRGINPEEKKKIIDLFIGKTI